MNAIAYTDQTERLVTLSPSTLSAAKVRVPRDDFVTIHGGTASAWNRPIGLPPANPWIAKVWSFVRLAPGWNGSRAPAPTLGAIKNAVRFVFAMTDASYQPTRVAPSAVGGVAVTRRIGDRKVLVEFFNDGSASALFADDATQQMQTQGVKITPSGYQDILDRMREYLDG